MSIQLTTVEALAEFLEYLATLIRQGFVDRVSMEAPLDSATVGTRVCVVFTTTLLPKMPDDWTPDGDDDDGHGDFEEPTPTRPLPGFAPKNNEPE